MLELRQLVKHYQAGGIVVEALRGVDMSLRKNEFVAVLGPSGCGKTTLLNIIGGLDHADGGDLLISGRSTKEFKDRDWVEITATVKKEPSPAYQGEGPVLYVSKIGYCEKPKQEVVSF